MESHYKTELNDHNIKSQMFNIRDIVKNIGMEMYTNESSVKVATDPLFSSLGGSTSYKKSPKMSFPLLQQFKQFNFTKPG